MKNTKVYSQAQLDEIVSLYVFARNEMFSRMNDRHMNSLRKYTLIGLSVGLMGGFLIGKLT